MSLFATFLGVLTLAFLDSLNPFSIAAMAIVIAGQASLSRGIVFIFTTFLMYFLGGILILSGWAAALKALLPHITPMMATIGWIGLAAACWIGAGMLWIKSPDAGEVPSSSPTAKALFGVFVFAFGSTVSDLPTAVPYFAAVPMILATQSSPVILGLWLAFYSLIYVSPLILLLWLRLLARSKFEPLIGKIRHGMDLLLRRWCPPLLVASGIWALVQGIGGLSSAL
jgi:hypothetical protein